MYDVIFTDIDLALPTGIERGALATQKGRIAAITAPHALDGVSAQRTIAGDGRLLLPGGVDAHTHFDLCVGGKRVADGYATAGAAAIAGGTTSVIEHISFSAPGSAHGDALAQARARLAAAYPPLHVYLHDVVQRVDDELPAHLAAVAASGIHGVKAYTTYAQPVYGDALTALLRLTKQAGLLLCLHAEDDALVRAAQDKLAASGQLSASYHAQSRPATAEAESVRQALEAAHAAGDAPIYLVHLSSAAALAYIRAARERGQANIYCETCPQYLLLTEARYAASEDDALRCLLSPPLRRQEDCDALWQGLADGTIDVLATDHCCYSLAQKRPYAADFRTIPGGAPGVGERLPLLFGYGVAERRITAARAVEVACTTPAKLFCLHNKGELRVGADADLALFDPATATSFTDSDPAYSLYNGLRVPGSVTTIAISNQTEMLS